MRFSTRLASCVCSLLLLLSWDAQAKKCGSYCKASKRNHKNAKKACDAYKKKYKRSCVVRKQKLCASGWRTLKSFKGKGANYRACIKKLSKKELNEKKAKESCTKYKKKYHKPCKIRRGVSCGNGWRKIARFGSGSIQYRSCRKKLKNETANKIRNAYNSTTFLANAYKAYFAWLRKGASMRSIPPKLRAKYQKYYRVNLGRIRVGLASRVKKGAITDCYKIYFASNKTSMMDSIRKGRFKSSGEERLFLHEVAHSEQCYLQGGRNNYAKLWFKQLPVGILKSLTNKVKVNKSNIHDRMPMEVQAESKAVAIRNKVQNHDK